MGKPLSDKQKRGIEADLLTGDYSFRQLSKRWSVSESTISRIGRIKTFSKVPSVHFHHKDEPYRTEAEALSSPFYKAINRHLITPIRSDWKL